MTNDDPLIEFIDKLRQEKPIHQTRETENYRRMGIINGINCTGARTVIISENSLFNKAAEDVLTNPWKNKLDTIVYHNYVKEDEVVIGTPNDSGARIVSITTQYDPW